MRNDRSMARLAVGTIAVSLALVSSTAFVAWRTLRMTPAAPAYVSGDVVDVPPALYAEAGHTMLLFVKASCQVCQAEAPELSRLADRLRALTVPTVVVTGSSDVEADRAFATSLGDHRHQHLAFDTLRVKTVPTIMLVDQRGVVVYAQQGRSKTVNLMEELIQRIPRR